MNSKIRTAALTCSIALGGLWSSACSWGADPIAELRDARPGGIPAPATTEPTGAPGSDEGGARNGMGQRRFGGDPAKEKDWDAALAFMKANSPLRTKAVTDLPDTNPMKQRLEGMVLFTYRNTAHLKTDTDHELFDAVVTRIQAEDAIFGLVADNQKSPGDAALKAKLKDQVSKFVDINLKERQLRLDKLKKFVDEQQANLNQDNAAKAGLVDTDLQAAMKGDLQPFTTHGPRGGGGNGGGRNRTGPEDQGPPAEPKPQ